MRHGASPSARLTQPQLIGPFAGFYVDHVTPRCWADRLRAQQLSVCSIRFRRTNEVGSGNGRDGHVAAQQDGTDAQHDGTVVQQGGKAALLDGGKLHSSSRMGLLHNRMGESCAT